MTRAAQGRLIALAGVIALSPDATLVRLVGSDPWSLLAWRGLASAAVLLAALLWAYGPRAVVQSTRALDRAGWGAALCLVTGSIGFVAAITYASIATALVIVATSPIFSAIASRILLAEMPSRRLQAAIALGLLGTAVAAGGEAEGGGSAPVLGMAMAFLCAASLGLQLTLLRAAKGGDNLLSMVLGGVAVGVIGALVGAPLAFSASQAGYALLMSALFVPLAYGLFTYAPRLIPSAEVALILLLEAPLGTLAAWLVIGEAPTAEAIAGGALVLAALALFTSAPSTRGPPPAPGAGG